MLEDVTAVIGLMASVEGTSTRDYLGQHTVTLHAPSQPGGAEVIRALTAWTLDLWNHSVLWELIQSPQIV